jgi:hypothetical protein
MSKRKLTLPFVALAALACSLLAVPSFADSQVRIVRLSDVEGKVQIDRNTGQGYEKAFLNLPITQGMKIQAKNEGRAEVEFEDGSTLRITPGTTIEFPELSLRDSGAKVSTVEVQEGTAYLDFNGSKQDAFTLKFGHESLALTHSAHLRVQMDDTNATLAVFKGDVEVEGPSGAVEVGKKQSATFDLADQDRYTLAKNFEEDPYDSWDKQQGEYHERYLAKSSYNTYSPYAYGMSDLNYYGNYFDVPGYGMMWQPYFVGSGWDPFMNGSWVYYPGFGYTWVSAYPWGWTPYRYGSWAYVPAYGWCWQPSGSNGSWAGWNTIPRVVNPPQRFVPPQPPSAPGNGTVVVNRGPVVVPGGSPRRVIIRNDSAGLGIPRGSIHNLSKISQEVRQEGSASVKFHAAPVQTITVAPSASTSQSSTVSAPRTVAPRVASPRMSSPAPAPRSAQAPRSAPTPRK